MDHAAFNALGRAVYLTLEHVFYLELESMKVVLATANYIKPINKRLGCAGGSSLDSIMMSLKCASPVEFDKFCLWGSHFNSHVLTSRFVFFINYGGSKNYNKNFS